MRSPPPLTALLGGNFGIQVIMFAVVTVVTLLLTRKPLLRLMRRTPSVPSNASNVIGRRAVVVIAIEAGPGQRGQVRVGTEHWSAKSEDEQPIAEGTTVEVVRIDGVALVVRPVGECRRSLRRRSRGRGRTRARRWRRRRRPRSR